MTIFASRAPRADFDHVQHNAPNPVLAEFREWDPEYAYDFAFSTEEDDPRPVADMIREILAAATDAQRDHARKVLTRLAQGNYYATLARKEDS